MESGEKPEGYRILVADDDPALLELLEIALANQGYQVTFAADGREALEAFKKREPHLVILDLRMPKVGGLEVLKEVKRISPHTEAIIITSYADRDSAIEVLHLGAFDYIPKPFRVERLQLSVRKALERYQLLVDREKLLAELKQQMVIRTKELHALTALAAASNRKKEEQLLRSEKLAAVGQLAAGVAHELGNALAIISSSVQYLLKHCREDCLCHGYLEVIHRNVAQADRIIGSLLSFARPHDPAPTPVDVAHMLEGICLLLKGELAKQHISVLTRFSPDVPLVMADQEQLHQVFLNLLLNAIQAMPEGGSITLTTAFDPEGTQVKIEVADTGGGIPPEDLNRIFDPFFTTKERGTGLGLSVSYRLIQAHEGNIQVDSREGRGTVFTLSLPAVPLKVHHA